jgi:amino acid transporter
MIQRVQSIYYALAMICVSIASFGANIYVFQGSETRYEFNAFGISEFTTSDNVDALSPMPYYIVGICLILLAFIALMSYKNHKRQLAVGRLTLFVYFVLVILTLLGSFLGHYLTEEETLSRNLGAGFFFFIAGFPFIFLGNIGVKRDKNLLESLDRLR